ncbi:LpxI family protein [Ahrensia sp. R2A130]|uniref:LpxI family protein n=1 Tax=Ahrensia sp. R2A130 TaxID=744979 RepID=UPI0001E0C99B|nr:UDP-2,3-diacylglucosamine diphosphatase LpxI [Ahrensia sp. R2A130]EFL90244.1 phosphatidate cytidyltransferase [Ahrensia sp. R2A130]
MTWRAEHDRVAILAGSGALPIQLATQLTTVGLQPYILRLPGVTEKPFENLDGQDLRWEQVGQIFPLCKEHSIGHIVLAGGVDGRPDLKFSQMDWPTLRTLPTILGQLLKGDDAVLGSVITVIEKRGLKVLGAADIAPSLVVDEGRFSGAPGTKDRNRIDLGFQLLDAMSPFDMGQACVVIGGRPVAVEGAEGTDAMLRRIMDLRDNGRLPLQRGGVMVKAPKAGQDHRVDMPTIGPETVSRAVAAGLDGIAVRAGATLILERETCIDIAQRGDLFLTGIAA